MEEPKPSLVKNLTGGAGCGCGCLGMLGALLGVALLLSVWLEMYADPGSAPTTLGILTMVMGLGAAGFGAVVWIVSILMD
jgi:hypothetical protein